MMNLSCDVIRDLLPLYAEGIASEASTVLVSEHLKTCADCRKQYESMNVESAKLPESGIPLKKIRNELRKKKTYAVILAAAAVLAILITAFAYLSTSDYFPYTENLLQVSELADGSVLIAFDDAVTGYSMESYVDEDGFTQTDLMAWQTTLDQWRNKGPQTARIPADVDTIWYCTPGQENQWIAGRQPDWYGSGGVITLPRLFLNTYALLSIIIAVLTGILWILLRKRETAARVLEKVFFLPVAYIIGHICVKGFSGTSYSPARDFFLILLTAFVVYGLLLIAVGLLKQWGKPEH